MKCHINGECYNLEDSIDFSQDPERWIDFLAELEDESTVMRSMLDLVEKKYIKAFLDEKEISEEEYRKCMNDRITNNNTCIEVISGRL